MGKITITESDIRKMTKAIVNEVIGQLYKPDKLTMDADKDFFNNSQTMQTVKQILKRGGWEFGNMIENGKEEVGLFVRPMEDKPQREIIDVASAINQNTGLTIRPVPYLNMWILYIKRKDSEEYAQIKQKGKDEYNKEWQQERDGTATQYTPAGLK